MAFNFKTQTKTALIFIEFGELSYFAIQFFKELFTIPFEKNEFLKQCYQVGNRSLQLVAITGFIIGAVLTLQARPVLQEFGAVSMMPNMVGISIIRELGPVITALVCAGRIASGIGAELGSMRVTEQIDAMEISGTNPFKYLVVTRVLATTLMLPLLVAFGDAMALLGSAIIEKFNGDASFTLYFNEIFSILDFSDFLPAIIKSLFFGFAIGLVGSFKGYYCEKGTTGVGLAANSAVVFTSLLLFFIDFVAVFFFNTILQ